MQFFTGRGCSGDIPVDGSVESPPLQLLNDSSGLAAVAAG